MESLGPGASALNWLGAAASTLAAGEALSSERPACSTLTSPVELMRAVRRLFPQPQVFCAFHTRSVGAVGGPSSC